MTARKLFVLFGNLRRTISVCDVQVIGSVQSSSPPARRWKAG